MEKKIKDRLNALKSKLAERSTPKLGRTLSSIYTDYQYELEIRIDELEKLLEK